MDPTHQTNNTELADKDLLLCHVLSAAVSSKSGTAHITRTTARDKQAGTGWYMLHLRQGK